METSTGPVPEAKKMRVSFLVLAGVIAVCNANASAKALAPATEDEANGVGKNPAEQGPQNDTAYETAVKKSNIHGGEHILSRRHLSHDSGKRRSVVKKKSDKKKTESKKFESKKFEEHKSKSVKNKTSSRRTEKRESQDKKSHGLVTNDWFMPQYNSKTVSVPVIYRDPHKYHAPWALQANFAANLVGADHENKVLRAKELLKVEEWADIFHNSLKEGLESFFGVLDKELRKKIEQTDAKPASNTSTRSACIDAGDGSSEGESTEDADLAAAMSRCSDDGSTTTYESGNGIGPSDMSKRSGESPLEYLQETLPVVVQAAQTILAELVGPAKPPGGDRIVEDYGMYDRRSSGVGDEAVEPAPDYGNDNEMWVYDDFYMDHGPAESPISFPEIPDTFL